jgi:hypothetical protein
MKVKDLIEFLKHFDPETLVIIDGIQFVGTKSTPFSIKGTKK